MAYDATTGLLDSFVAGNGLSPGTDGPLPTDGGLFGRTSFKVEGAGHGELPGGLKGTILHCTYEVRSDDSTRTYQRTAVVARVPAAMGYLPYLMVGSGIDLSTAGAGAERYDAAEGVRALVEKGVDRGWLTELFSPAFSEWLQRSPGDFGAEYLAGVLTVVRDTLITDATELTNLCADAAKIAGRLREEASEATEAGGGKAAKNVKVDRNARIAAGVIDELGPGSPADVASELSAASAIARRDGGTIARTIKLTILWLVGINVIGGGIYGLLLNLGDPLKAVLIYQVILVLIVAPLTFRSVSRSVATIASEEAFFRGYAKAHDLKALEPLAFAAEYADANLPGEPVRVFEGSFGGEPGVLMTTGDGRTRGDQIALVRGIRGPTATTELNVSAPGISARDLDAAVETLVLDLETAPPTATG
ncbi:MAG: hypothetical protein U0R51_12860 [Solirubrobacterales bacterium]